MKVSLSSHLIPNGSLLKPFHPKMIKKDPQDPTTKMVNITAVARAKMKTQVQNKNISLT